MTRYIFLIVLSASLGVALAANPSLDAIWEKYKESHNKEYTDSTEESSRRLQWEENVNWIQNHNLEFDLGLQTYRVGLTPFTDWSMEEYRKYMLGARIDLATPKDNRLRFVPRLNAASLPDEVDWRGKGYVTPVKDQGRCGSCWAFSSTGALEGQHFRKTGTLVSLSEENLVDCVSKNKGCGGGWMDNSFDYVQSNGGIDTEQSYPYMAKQGTCHYNSSSSGSTCSGHVDLPAGNETALQVAVATIGPIAVAIDANHKSFMQYKEGIFYDSTCSHESSDHAVLVVGYGQENGYDYWLVKNSWSTQWGDQGYVKMARNVNNMCAIAAHASYPLV